MAYATTNLIVSHTILAIFENGVFRPLEKVDLDNRKAVAVILLDRADSNAKRSREILSAFAGCRWKAVRTDFPVKITAEKRHQNYPPRTPAR